MSQLSDALAQAQQDLADFKANPPAEYTTTDLITGQTKYTPAYTTRLGQLEATVRDYQQKLAAEQNQPAKTVTGKDGTIYSVNPDGTITPQGGQPGTTKLTPGSELVDPNGNVIATGPANAALLRDQGGYYSAQADLAKANAAVALANQQLEAKKADIDAQYKNGTLTLEQAKFEYQKVKDQLDLQVTQQSQAMEQEKIDAQRESDQRQMQLGLINAGTSLASTYARDLAPSAAFGDVNEAIKSLGSGGTYRPQYTGSAATPYDPTKLAFQAIAHISPYAAAALGSPVGSFAVPAALPAAAPTGPPAAMNAQNFVGQLGSGYTAYGGGQSLGQFPTQAAAEQAYNQYFTPPPAPINVGG